MTLSVLASGLTVDCWIGLGSNLGDRVVSVQSACRLIANTPGVEVVATSSVYESDPWGFLEQPPFLNAVAQVRTTLGPLQLVFRLQGIESTIGRRRTFRWGPREIDLDLLTYGSQSIDRRGLTLPHPFLEQRAFVLVPLREIAPAFRAHSGRSIDEMLEALGSAATRVRRVEGRLLSSVAFVDIDSGFLYTSLENLEPG